MLKKQNSNTVVRSSLARMTGLFDERWINCGKVAFNSPFVTWSKL